MQCSKRTRRCRRLFRLQKACEAFKRRSRSERMAWRFWLVPWLACAEQLPFSVAGKSIYFLVVDRFARSGLQAANQSYCDLKADWFNNTGGGYCGGTLRGIIDRLDYIQVRRNIGSQVSESQAFAVRAWALTASGSRRWWTLLASWAMTLRTSSRSRPTLAARQVKRDGAYAKSTGGPEESLSSAP